MRTIDYAIIGILLALVVGVTLLIRAVGGVESAVREQTKRGVLIQMKSPEEIGK